MNIQTLCILGLGHVGLPLAALLACRGYHVIGVDTKRSLIEDIESSPVVHAESDLKVILNQALGSGNLTLSSEVQPADAFILAVPTPIDERHYPDCRDLYAAVDMIDGVIIPGNLVLIESTCPIGTTAKVSQALQQHKVFVAYCPERVMPGNTLTEMIQNDRVVGGVDDTSTQAAAEFYQTFVDGNILTTDARTAEAVKLAENAYRDVNIAYANELSMICEDCDINTRDVIELANHHPRVNILQPGLGVGGHCLAVDPYFLLQTVQPHTSSLIRTARVINDNKTQRHLKSIKKLAKQYRANTIACLGLTYKPNVADFRNSPACDIANQLQHDFTVLRHDPYLLDSVPLQNINRDADIVIQLVDHDEFSDIENQLSRDILFINLTEF